MGKKRRARRAARGPDTIGFINDLHCGSRWGMLHPDSELGRQNVGQRYMWDCWMQLAREWPSPLDLLVLNGDIIDGKQYKSGATGLVTAKLSEQEQIAEEVLEPFLDIVKPRRIVRTEGTPYHEGFDGAMRAFDNKFGVRACDQDAGEQGDIVIDMELRDGIIMNVKHQPEGSAALYMGTVADRETIWATITEDKQPIPRARFLVRSHLHTYFRLDGCGKIHIITPCWQLQSAHAKHRRYYRWHPTIGAVLLRYDEMHDYRYHVSKRTFPLPERRAISYAAL